jgi:hypothetical protein
MKKKYIEKERLGFVLNRAEQRMENVIYMFRKVKKIENSIVLLQLSAIKINCRLTDFVYI